MLRNEIITYNVTLSFDANGNLTLANTGGALTTYSWESENRLTRVDNSDGTNEQYTYNAAGLRQKVVKGATTQNFLWDDNNIVQESNAGLVVQVRYTDLPGIWGGLFSVHQSGGSSFYVPDYQGTTRQLANTSQTVTDTLLTDAWGREVASTGTTTNPFRYEGQYGLYRDVAGRLNAQQRHLDTVNGRWISRDPTGFAGGDWNLYRYTGNCPSLFVDPNGLGDPWWKRLCCNPAIRLCCGGGLPTIPPGDRLPWDPPGPRTPPVQPVFGWAYGACCGNGSAQQATCDPACPTKPQTVGVSCVDKACCNHDCCVGDWNGWYGRAASGCDATLCDAAMACLFKGCASDPGPAIGGMAGLRRCRRAAAQVALLFCTAGMGTFPKLRLPKGFIPDYHGGMP